MGHAVRFAILACLLTLLGGVLQAAQAGPPRDLSLMTVAEPSDEALQQWWQSLPKEDRPLRQKYPRFRDLPEEKQQKFRRRWQKYQEMTPQEREQMQQRYQRWQSLSPEERRKLRETYRQFKDLPPQQRDELRRELHKLQELPEADRERHRDELRRRYFQQQPGPEPGPRR